MSNMHEVAKIVRTLEFDADDSLASNVTKLLTILNNDPDMPHDFLDKVADTVEEHLI